MLVELPEGAPQLTATLLVYRCVRVRAQVQPAGACRPHQGDGHSIPNFNA